eukprot:COSAG02_NODE_27462_length_609_cov_0.837255_1_plen_25_part_01
MFHFFILGHIVSNLLGYNPYEFSVV